MVKYIEGEPYINVPAEPGFTNIERKTLSGERITGLNTENAEIEEGIAYFDIIFYVRLKDGLSQMILNIEAQKKDPSEYDI